MNCKRKSRRRFFLLMRSRTPPISSEFRGGLNPPNHPPRYATGYGNSNMLANVYRNIEMRSRNPCCRRKVITITYSDSVCWLSYPACNANVANLMFICGLSDSVQYFFPHYPTHRKIFGKTLLNIKCVL